MRHARSAPAPLLDLKLLKVDTFYASVVGGFLFRIGVGAMPFLLPLLLQLGFGLIAVPVGHAHLRHGARRHRHEDRRPAPILRRFGFRQVLVVNAFVSAAFIAATALFDAGDAACG